MSRLTRRALLSAVSAIAGTGASGASPRDILSAVGAVGSAAPSTNDYPAPNAFSGECVRADETESIWSKSRPVRRQITLAMRAYNKPVVIPPHIAARRSWSAVYSAGVAEREYRALAEADDALDDDRLTVKILAALGIAGDQP